MAPVSRESIRSRAQELGLRLPTERDLDALVAFVEGNEATFRAIDGMPLDPGDSPFAFVRRLEPWGKRRGR